jgi:hypothetical protein
LWFVKVEKKTLLTDKDYEVSLLINRDTNDIYLQMTDYQKIKEISPSLRSVEMTTTASIKGEFGAALRAAPNSPLPHHPFDIVTSTKNIERSEILKGEVSTHPRKPNPKSLHYAAVCRGRRELEMIKFNSILLAEEVSGGRAFAYPLNKLLTVRHSDSYESHSRTPNSIFLKFCRSVIK